MRFYSLPSRVNSFFLGFLVSLLGLMVIGCVAPATAVFSAADDANSALPETCPDFSGLWLITADTPSCQPTDWGMNGEPAIQLPSDAGFYLPQLPAEVRISQEGCQRIGFRIIRDSAGKYSSEGGEVTFDLSSDMSLDTSWSEDRLAVRYQPREVGPIIVPGAARSWATWSLELLANDQLDYKYLFVEKGAMLFLFPFQDEAGSSCLFQRLTETNGETG